MEKLRRYVEKLVNDYPRMVKRRQQLRYQIDSYRPVPIEDVILSMCFSHPEGERVQSSDLSDKTAKVAMKFRARAERMEQEAIGAMVKEYDCLDEEISFLEECIRQLPSELSEIMCVLVLGGASWDEAEEDLSMSRKQIAVKRSEAMDRLALMFQRRASKVEAMILC